MGNDASKLNVLVASIVIAVSAATAGGVVLGPNPVLVDSPLLAPPNQGLNDQRDWLILSAWWIVAALAALTVSRLRIGSPATESKKLVIWHPALIASISTIAILLIAAQLFVDLDRTYTDNFPRMTINELLGASLLGVFVLFLGRRLSKPLLIASVVVSLLLALVYLPALLQTPGGIRDEGHFFYTANELAAPAVGLLPLGGFISQYTNLLGYPIAPLLRMFPDSSALIIVMWLVLLQVVCLLLPVLATRLVAGNRFLLLSVIIPTALVCMTSQSQIRESSMHAANTYFATFPMRTLFPSLLVASLMVLCHRGVLFTARGALTFGLVAGLTGLNNADFGLPAVVAAVIAVLALSPRSVVKPKWAINWVLGAALSIGSYLLLLVLSGRSIRVSDYLFFHRVFGSAGFMNEPMAPGGLHVVFAVIFIASVSLSVLAVGRARHLELPRLHVASLFLAFSSVWATLTLIYFSGRSFTSTLTGGLSFQLGLVIVAVALWLVADIEFVRKLIGSSMGTIPALTAIGVAAGLIMVMALLRAPRPDLTWDRLFNGGAQLLESARLNQEAELLSTQIAEPYPTATRQLLILSNLLELEGGATSELVVNHPAYLALSPIALKRQCEHLAELPSSLIIESTASAPLSSAMACRDLLHVQSVTMPAPSEDVRFSFVITR